MEKVVLILKGLHIPYFNQHLLDVDGRFATDLDYLFVAQDIVESKQVLGDSNNFMWRQKPSRWFTASQVQMWLANLNIKMKHIGS